MKSKCSFILRSSIALILAVLMLFGSLSTVLAATIDVAGTGATITSDGSMIIFVNAGAVSWWQNDSATQNIHIWGGTGGTKDVTGTKVSGNIYSFVIPSGTYTSIIYYRGDWWNQTGDCTFTAGKNYISSFSERGTSLTWETRQETSTASLAASSTSVSTGENVTLTPSLSTNTAYNAIKSTSYSVTTNPGSGGSVTSAGVFSATAAGTYTVTATVTYNAKGFTGITKTATATKNITVTAASCDYYTHVMWRDFGGTTYTPDETYGSVPRNTSTAPTADIGTLATLNTFDGWYVGDDGNATSTTGLTKYPNNTDYTNSSISIAYNTSVKHYYAFLTRPEPSYSVTVAKGAGGNVASTSVTAHPSTKVTLPTATPDYGYKFKNWTATGGITITNPTSASAAQITATGTGTVTANFEKNDGMNLYIAGRFHIYNGSSWVNSFDSGDWSNTGDDNIKFTWDSTAQKYKVNTGASPAELTSQISNINPYFFVYDKTNFKNWYATSSTTLTNSNKTVTLSKSSGANNNLRFNATSTDKPVTLWFDPTTGVLSYDIPAFYDVTVGTATGGTVTASPTRCEAGTSVTLTIAPTTGYQLKSITAKDSSNASVTLDGTGNTRTFTMPAKDVTVTPVFEKISYAVSVDAKYSNDGTNFNQTFPSGSKPAVTIAADTATQLDGVAVTAPANDPEGYVFAGWTATSGSFTNDANKDTTFKPTAANAVAIAKYKKKFSITSSVDNTGTGAGTVTTSKTEVEAGGSYTITASAKSGSAVESVKVNGTAKTATASQTISSVSADQTVVVKFKSNVYLKGTMNETAWAGDVMQANSDGTSYSIVDVVLDAGTTYQFRLYANDAWKANSVDTWTLNNIATHGTSGNNLTITPSVKAKVTFVSDGTKFTSITAIPYNSTQYNVTLTQSADYTITATYMDVEYTTAGKNANVTVPVYSGTGFSYTVTPASGKYLSAVAQSESVALSPAFVAATHANSYTGSVASVSKAFAVSATTANKLSVSAKTNKSTRGTISVSPTTAVPGETITITVTPLAGSLKALTASYANGHTYEYKNNTWTEVIASSGSSNTGALANVFLNPAKAAFNAAPTGAAMDDASIGATMDMAEIAAMPDLVPVGATQEINMTLAQPSAVTINATFDPYSAESEWYYNGYTTGGTAESSYFAKQMTEGMVGGEIFSYYHVEGRTGSDQLMTVSDGKVETGTRYVYFTQLKSGGWDYSHSPHAYFIGASNSWPGGEMTWYCDNDMNQPVYRIAIPAGATGIVFNDNGTHKSTDINDLSAGGYYVDEYSTYDGSKSVHAGHTYNCSYPDAGTSASGTEYFYSSSIYTADFSTKGFYNHYANNKTFAKPKDLHPNTGDYYVNVLYPGKTYTINGVTKTVGSDPLVIWSAEPLAGDDENVTVYAKDGSIRSESYGSTYANIANTKIYAADGTTAVGTNHTGNIANQTWETYKAAKGDTLVIKTQIGATDSGTLNNAADLKATYYVRGFCVNGEVSQLLEWKADGLYTTTFKVPEDGDITKFEITPIYYLKDTEAHPIVTYRATGFTDELKAVGAGKPGWGDTLYTYPYYGKLGSNNNALGAYPGQPMVYYKGQYQMQIPQKSTAWDIYYDDSALSSYSGNTAKANAVANTAVSGVTMSNGYYDIVHRQIMGYGSNGASADHVQTYDYGDFYKIFNEKDPVDNIVFDFKYRTKKHNFENQPAASVTKSTLDTNYGTNGNGFELLTNFHGRNVDLFGTPLSGDAADPSKTTPVYVVSIGGVNGSSGVENVAGYYATEWMVYGSSNGTSYNRITAGNKSSIPPEILILNDDDDTSFNTTTYPSADANHTVNDWKALYTALEAYRGKPVMISYEAADAQIGAGNYATSGGGGATRNDGRWLYSKNGENITSTIKIQYSDDNGDTYTDLDKTTPQVEGLSAYFTNDGVEGEMTYSTTIDPDKTFDFEAKTTNGNYKFVGWYMADGTKITSDNVAHTERSGSYTFVAKFMKVEGGQLILSHSADKGTINGTDYQGVGTTQIGAVVKNGDEVIRTYDLSTSDITLDDKIIKSDSTYTIDITLTALPTGIDRDGTTVLATPSGQETKFFNNPTVSTSGDGTPITYTFTISVSDLFNGTHQDYNSLIYHSYFLKTSFHYNLVFQYYDRNGETKQYYRSGYLTAAQASNPEYVSVVETTPTSHERRLMPAFIEKVAPHISNFAQDDVVWDIAPEGYAFSVMNYNYTLERPIVTRQQGTNTKDVTFVLPYAHNNGIATVDGDKAGTAAKTTNFTLNGENAVDFDTIPVLPNDGENGIYTEDEKKNWIAAPKTITDGSDTLYFQYWSVKKTTAAGESDPELARCYFQGFNFVALDNYTITPIYDTQSTDISKSGVYTGASYLETSRNQWNGNATTGEFDHYTVDPSTGKKKASAADRAAAADLLYNDFVLNYNFKGVDIYKGESDSADIQDLGVVVERIKELDINQDGSKNTNIANYTSVAENLDTVRGVINGTTTNSKFIKDSIAKTALDNKNRILFYEAFYNGAGWIKDNQDYASKYTYKNYVYRAYTYIKYTDDLDQTQIQLSVPTYFTMYDEATAGYSAPTTNTSGN